MSFRRPTRLIEGGASTAEERAAASLLSNVPATTVDASSVDRVWQRLAEPERPAWYRRLRIPMGVMAALATFVLWTRPVTHPTPLGVELLLSSGGVAKSEQQLQTDASGRALLRLPSVAGVLLYEGARASIEGATLRLTKGSLSARTSKQPFSVRTAQHIVRGDDSLFTVTVADGAVTVSAHKGSVAVLRGEVLLAQVTTGRRWTIGEPGTWSKDETSATVASLLDGSLAGRSREELLPAFEALGKAQPRPTLVPAVALTPAGTAAAIPTANVPLEDLHPTELSPKGSVAPLKDTSVPTFPAFAPPKSDVPREE